jgi:DnaJ-domain-containing protein 1
MSESRDYLEMTFRSINCFADDGTLQASELQDIFDIALRDGVVDANETRVLRNIIKRIKSSELTEEMRATLKKIEETVC